MKKEFLFKSSGVLVILAAVFLLGFGIGPNVVLRFFKGITLEFSEKAFNNFSIIGFFMAGVSPLAFTALYLRQSHKSGILGLVGFILVFALCLYSLCNRFFAAFIAPRMGDQPLSELNRLFLSQSTVFIIIFSVLFLGGVILFGISMIRAGIFPSLPSILFTAGLPAAMAGFFLPSIFRAFGTLAATTGMVWFGLFLLTEKTNSHPDSRIVE